MREIIASRETVTRKPPVNISSTDAFLFAHEYTKDIDETYAENLLNTRILPNGYLTDVSGLLLKAQSFASYKSVSSVKPLLRSLYYGAKSRSLPKLRHALFITDEFSNGFFHWFGDVLPKLELLVSFYGIDAIRRLPLIVPHMADFPYVLPSLVPYGLDTVCVLGKSESVLCESLLTCSPAAPTGNYRPLIMKKSRGRFIDHFGSTDRRDRKVFISRAQAPKRKIANEDELVPILERSGFERVVMENLAFSDQVKLLSETAVLIGNHGAGLVNMLFMRPGSSVVELRLRGDTANNCFFSLASALDISYRYQICDSIRPGEDTHTADFIVDTKTFSHILNSF